MNECLVNCSLEFEPVVETLGLPVWSGFIFLATSSLFWGSIYVPIKQFELQISHIIKFKLFKML